MSFVLTNSHWDIAKFERDEPNWPETPREKPRWRYVYVAREQDGHLLKIGLTASLRRRLRTLGAEPILVFRVPYWGAHRFEHQLHDMFAEDRLGGTEWFRPSHGLVSFVAHCLEVRPVFQVQRHWPGDNEYEAEVVA